MFSSSKRECPLVALCLTSHAAVADVAFGQSGLLSAGPFSTRRIVIDCSTGEPDREREFVSRADAAGVGWIDAPVSGGPHAAANGTLTIFMGGEHADIQAALPLLQLVSVHRTHMGPPGAGQTTKICNQLIVGANLLAIGETIALARKAGIAVERLAEALRGGFADSIPLQTFGPRMASHRFVPRLGAITLMEKDMALAMALAARHSATAPIARLCVELFAEVRRHQEVAPDADISAIISLFEAIVR